MSYIEREAAQKIICGVCGVCDHPTVDDLMRCDDVCPEFASIPAADVAPVRRGKWEQADGTWICSLCDEVPWWCGVCEDILPTYCPNCGARMDEEGEAWERET